MEHLEAQKPKLICVYKDENDLNYAVHRHYMQYGISQTKSSPLTAEGEHVIIQYFSYEGELPRYNKYHFYEITNRVLENITTFEYEKLSWELEAMKPLPLLFCMGVDDTKTRRFVETDYKQLLKEGFDFYEQSTD